MTNKFTFEAIVQTRLRFDVEFLTFSIGYVDKYEDLHIPTIILVLTIFPFSFKLLKYS